MFDQKEVFKNLLNRFPRMSFLTKKLIILILKYGNNKHYSRNLKAIQLFTSVCINVKVILMFLRCVKVYLQKWLKQKHLILIFLFFEKEIQREFSEWEIFSIREKIKRIYFFKSSTCPKVEKKDSLLLL